MALATRRHPCRPPPTRPARLRRRLLVSSDHSARIRGDARRVQAWIADLRHAPQWLPGTSSAVKLGVSSEPVRVGTRFELTREMLGLKLPMSYEVVELQPGKRLVLSGLSEHHTQMDSFFFMTDRHDSGFTAVRYIADLRLRQWRAYLQPLADRFVERVPEQSLEGLQRALNTAQSPVFSSDFDASFRAQQRGRGSDAAEASTSRAGRNGTGPGGGWLRDMLNGGRRSTAATSSSDDEFGASQVQSGGATSTAGSAAAAPGVVWDRLGYYSLLGLDISSTRPGDDEIRAAYRRRALVLHPDRQLGKPESKRAEMAAEFAALLRAYETLRDPDMRALYDAGELAEATLSL